MPFEPGIIPEGATPFQEGQSGNPKGRPKGTRNLSTILREMLQEEIEITTEEGKKEKKQLQDVIIMKLIKKANDGNLRAIEQLFDRTEGKANQKIETSGKTEQDLTIRIIDGSAGGATVSEKP